MIFLINLIVSNHSSETLPYTTCRIEAIAFNSYFYNTLPQEKIFLCKNSHFKWLNKEKNSKIKEHFLLLPQAVSRLHKKFFDIVFWRGVLIWRNDSKFDYFISKSHVFHRNTIFLILSNVKIPSPLERFKMKFTELFSENGDSTHIFRSLHELWNSVSF